MRRWNQLCVCALAAFAAVGIVGVASGASSPAARYRTLLAKPFPVAGLPAGYSSPRVSRTTGIYGAVGAVVAKFGGSGKGVVLYTVFQTHADATAAWNEWVTAGEGKAWFGTRVALGIARPNYMFLGIDKGTKNSLANVTGTVFTVTTNAVPPSAPSHNQAATVALARAATAHLLATR